MSDLKVQYLDNGVFMLLSDFSFSFSDKHSIVVPKGFLTDFGSVPKIFQSFISPVGKATKAYVIHDYMLKCLYDHANEINAKVDPEARALCDSFFYNALLKLKVNKTQAKLIYYCVRIHSYLSYNKPA